MTVRLYAFECGRLEIPLAFLLEGAQGKITVPIPSYLIVHPRRRVLFDSKQAARREAASCYGC